MLALIRKLMPIPKPALPLGFKRITAMVCMKCKTEIEVRSLHADHEVKFPAVTWEVNERIADKQETVAKKVLANKVKELTGKK